MQRTACTNSLVLACLFFSLIGCENRRKEPTEKLPRSVTVLELQRSDPSANLLLPGSVEPWRSENLGFEVSGRIEQIIKDGLIVEGPKPSEKPSDEANRYMPAPSPSQEPEKNESKTPPARDFSQEESARGELLGRLDDRQYQLRVAQGEAQIKSSEAEIRSLTTEIEQVIPQEIKEAEARLKLAEQELGRVKRLFEREAVPQAELDTAEAERDQAAANVEKIKASREGRIAAREAAQAQLEERKEMLRQYQIDLDHTRLYAPFPGEISEVTVNAGGYVNIGETVLTLIVMDPIQVSVEVAPSIERTFREGDRVLVFPPESTDAVLGYIYKRDTVADANTRTYTLEILVRNQRITDLPNEENTEELPQIERVCDIQPIDPTGDPQPAVLDESLHQDDKGWFVWKIEDMGTSRARPESKVLTLKKVRVKPGSKRVNLLNLIEATSLEDDGGLPLYTPIAANVPSEVKDGGKVLLVRERWLFRPGDLAQVETRNQRAPEGFYVPIRTVVHAAEEDYLFIAEPTESDVYKAKKIPVKVGSNVGEWLQIIPLEEGSLQAGALIVADGAHYLIEGESLAILERLEVRP
ncbi:Hypothetical protein PBC10988_28980 [Planctomycetales bacterium 10988]|nr:Hypothetical protein PBC10988_28980 [Planctomycetales bacterium 10988]